MSETQAEDLPHTGAPDLPGEEGTKRKIARMIRVDHAGEHGAVRIYEGQLAILRGRAETARSAALIEHMAAQEEEHLATFNRLVRERGVRPTALAPVWHMAGFALGAATALMGEKAAMACTAAVEEAIDDHYAEQAESLGDEDPELKGVIERFREDEAEHRATALAEGAEQATAYPLLSAAIKAGCRVAIKLTERI
jgi:ubiquinone biosynthesis monooxygenase Coq7